ncbi:MAG: LytR family transcriptional regulator [Clostridiales bacterium]|nr:LytR family transcriptional regulator [Clostridiales bacterium]
MSRKTNDSNKKQKKVQSEKVVDESIFKEVTINLKKMENDNKKKKSKKNKKKKNKFLKFILVALVITIITFVGLFIKRMNENGWTIGGFVATILGHDANTLANLSRINILVVGQSQNLTDTMLVCSYDPKTQDVAMISIPRDTFVGRNKLYATSSDKINAIYQIDPNLLLEKVNKLTGLDINYYIKVDTDGLRDLVDSIGGVYFDVPVDMDYDDSSQDLHIHLKAGYQLLDGNKAEQVVRFRHNNNGTTYPVEYGQEDIGRMRTQREFITQVIKQMAKAENITKVDDYIKIANNNVETNFDLWNLKDYAPYVIDLNTDSIKSETLPGAPEKCNNIWLYIHNKKQTDKMISELIKTDLTVEQQKNKAIKISILNGTKDEMNLDNLKNLLEENGYTVASTGHTTLTQKTTIINRTNQTSEVSNKLKDTVGVGIVSNSNVKNSEVDFTIIIGADY